MRPILLAICLAASLASSQTLAPHSVEFTDYPFLFRIQRVRLGDDVCALVKKDGEFHLEHIKSESIRIFEGTLDEPALTSLRGLLGNEELVKLTDADIPMSMIVDSMDRVQINVIRGERWQTLHFRDSSSRKPFHRVIDPLVSWLNAVQQLPHRELTEDAGRNNCLPSKRFELKKRPESGVSGIGDDRTTSASAGGTALAPSSAVGAFLLKMTTNRASGGLVSRSCMVVFASGRSHLEVASQEYRESVKAKVYERSLGDTELAELRQLLNAPEIKESRHNTQPEAIPVRELEAVDVLIPRENGIQKLSFFSYFGAFSRYRNVPNATDHELAILKPVQKWISAHIPTKSEFLLKDAKPNQCEVK